MKNINWKVRFSNPQFWIQVAVSILVPILTYFGIEAKDLTEWHIVGDLFVKAISNPYVLVMILVSLYNAVIDPTTKGVKDSSKALTYTKPSSH
ncbi:phage holin [Vagococcus penaei]|uniref:phage holin n=1 Tax=Vagococcus penaei TaxID=633807 RepID=UPI001B85F20D|nr:phage holin [Vagococcus penaei]